MSTVTVFGLHAVRALLAHHPARVRRLLLQQGRQDRRAAEVESLARAAGVPVAQRPAADLDRLSGEGAHQGAVAEVVPAEPLREDDLAGLVEAAGREAFVLVLDGVQDPHNLGACLRTAEAVGVTAVVVPRDRACGLTPVVRKVAAGAAELVPFAQVTNLVRCLEGLKGQGLWVVGTEGEATRDLYAADLAGPLALVMGAEGRGMRRLTGEACDFTVRLPMRGVTESLNVSVATGVVLYEALRQRLAAAAVAKPQ
ncbi:MAG: 23S rRNA (guanosine(2251)-2'-O)-methyltransferase RlmB [Steroidobacteraceae bacterium]|jgi:23S rRNA (guanosine2251-2'-O)-methyltransferase|nr:23S rRNA (guanosine(2251)-2'-O)-methyltransferase RlmB [Steroidobacteraceae bacterium]